MLAEENDVEMPILDRPGLSLIIAGIQGSLRWYFFDHTFSVRRIVEPIFGCRKSLTNNKLGIMKSLEGSGDVVDLCIKMFTAT